MNFKELVKNSTARKYAIVVIILALLVFVSGRMSGYIIAEQSYNTQLSNLTVQYAALNESYNNCTSSLSDKNAQITSLESEKSSLTSSLSVANSNLADCNTQLSNIKSSISLKDSQISELSLNYSSLAANSAKALCCVNKIFNPTLSAYYIQNNNIVCTNDTSKTAFTC